MSNKMEINLANAYAFLKKTYSDIDAIYNYPPSYLKTMTGEDKKIIFICKMDVSKLKAINYLSPKKKNLYKSNERDLNLTGSPLKDECDIDTIDMSFDMKLLTPWSSEEEAYFGIPVDQARSIMCNYNFQSCRDSSNGSIWLLCDACDESHTIFLHFEFIKGFNSRGIVRYNGVLPTYQINSADLIKKHLSVFRTEISTVDSTIENYFNIKQSSISLKLFWSSSSMNPALNNLKNCKVLLHHSLNLNDCSLVTNDFLNQLKLLSIIKDNIVNYNESLDEIKEPNYNGIGIERIQDKILTIMTDHSGLNDMDSPILGDIEIEVVVQNAKIRLLMDLTDKLWEILKCCSSYRELKLAFDYVFQSAAKCNIVNMPTNKNRLAELIREVSQRRLAIPRLTGTEPLELLLEIGLEKLFKDYEYIFTESKMCRVDDLNMWKISGSLFETPDSNANCRTSVHKTGVRDSTMPIRKTLLHLKIGSEQNNDTELFGIRNSNFELKEINQSLSKLLQVHLTLEHLMIFQINLNMKIANSEICSQILSRPIRPFDDLLDSGLDIIEIPLHIDSVVQYLESMEPSTRKIILLSKNKFREVQSTFLFSMENIFPPDIFAGIKFEEKEFSCEKSYYCWNYSKIMTRNC